MPFTRTGNAVSSNSSTLVSAGVEFNQSLQQLVIADVVGGSLLISPYFFVYFCISEKKQFTRSSFTDCDILMAGVKCEVVKCEVPVRGRL